MLHEILQCLWTNVLTRHDKSDMGSKWENDSNHIVDVTHNFKSVQPKIILTPLVMVSSFWEEVCIVLFFYLKISLSLHNSIGIRDWPFNLKGGLCFFSKKNILILNVAEKNILILVEEKKIIWFRVFVI
jgi:hypothetical protein